MASKPKIVGPLPVLENLQHGGLRGVGGFDQAPFPAIAIFHQIADASHLEKRHIMHGAYVGGGGTLHRLAQRTEPLVEHVADGTNTGHLRDSKKLPSTCDETASRVLGTFHEVRIE